MADKHSLNGTGTPPPATDASFGLPKSPSVNQDSTRSSTAPTPKALGPRVA